jgi:hypothetical protein
MSDISKHWFVLPVPENVKPLRAWGARAILREERIRPVVKAKGKVKGDDTVLKVTDETLADRAQYRGPGITSAESRAFFAWLDKTGMPRLRKLADDDGLRPDEDRIIAVDDGHYHIRANPRKSFGYLYITAWEA